MNRFSRARTREQVPASPQPEAVAPLPRALAIAVIVGSLATPLAFSLYTDQIWEDSFITLRHAENLLQGNGLVFNPGERIHGFTSPINVLGLALCSFVTGQTSYAATMWAYRLLCFVAFAASAWLIARRLWAETPEYGWFTVSAFTLLYVFDNKAVEFTSNGMETAFVLLFLAGAISLLASADPTRFLARGLYWSGIMWGRPDGCVYIAALVAADLCFTRAERLALLRSLFQSGLVCAAVYLPWFAFAWGYYGTPVPHTIVAKGPVEIGAGQQIGNALLAMTWRPFYVCRMIFQPSYGWFESGRIFSDQTSRLLLNILSQVVGLFAMFYVLLPVRDRLGRATSLCFLLLVLYLAFMPFPYPWYMPPAGLFGLITLVLGIVTLSALAVRKLSLSPLPGWHPLAAAVLAVLLAGQVALFFWATSEARFLQDTVEWGNRREAGLWLREHGQPTESIYLEPLGYIGYFSGMRMVDWPGLVAPQVVEMRRAHRGGQLEGILVLRPDWVVLRKREYDGLGNLRQAFEEQYELSKTYDATEAFQQNRLDPPKPQSYHDAVYHIFRRRDLRPDDFRT